MSAEKSLFKESVILKKNINLLSNLMAPVNTIRNKEGIDDESLILKFVKNF